MSSCDECIGTGWVSDGDVEEACPRRCAAALAWEKRARELDGSKQEPASLVQPVRKFSPTPADEKLAEKIATQARDFSGNARVLLRDVAEQIAQHVVDRTFFSACKTGNVPETISLLRHTLWVSWRTFECCDCHVFCRFPEYRSTSQGAPWIHYDKRQQRWVAEVHLSEKGDARLVSGGHMGPEEAANALIELVGEVAKGAAKLYGG